MQLLQTLQNGMHKLMHQQKLLLLVVVLFLLPLVALIVLQQFNQTASANIATAQQQKTGAIHDALHVVLLTDQDQVAVAAVRLQETTPDLSKVRLYQVQNDVVEVLVSLTQTELGATSTISTILSTGRVTPGETFSITVTDSVTESVQSVRTVLLGGTEFIIFTEQDRTQLLTLLQARTQQAYLFLSLLCLCLLLLGYWLSRQVDWQQKHEQLRATLHERDLFTNMIAHEFRTPLTAIKGYISFLQESTTMTPQEHRFADTVRVSTERLVLLVNDFLEIARIQSGRLTLAMDEVDIAELVTTVSTSLEPTAQEKNLTMTTDIAHGLHQLHTDGNRLTQILTNLISNSIKYTEAGTISVLLESDQHHLTIRIKDTGTGISANDQAELFQPFARVGGVDQTTITGTGLGMWITKQLTELLHGTIGVESIEGVGTQIVLTFPTALDQ